MVDTYSNMVEGFNGGLNGSIFRAGSNFTYSSNSLFYNYLFIITCRTNVSSEGVVITIGDCIKKLHSNRTDLRELTFTGVGPSKTLIILNEIFYDIIIKVYIY